VVAVEGVNNYNGLLTPGRIYDEVGPVQRRSDSLIIFMIFAFNIVISPL
jgi:hypothetical protein